MISGSYAPSTGLTWQGILPKCYLLTNYPGDANHGNKNLSGRQKIILADDDSDDRELFLEAVQESGLDIKVELADDGCKLIEMLGKTENLPDMIFLDLNMPNKNGKECLAELRNIEEYRHIPIIIYSTSSSAKDIDDTFNKGANLYVKKPSSFSELLQVTKEVLKLDWNRYSPHASRKDFVFPVKNM